MVLADSHRIPRAPCYSGARARSRTRFRLRGSHPLRPPFPGGSATTPVCHCAQHRQALEARVPQPRGGNPCRVSHHHGLAMPPLSLATTHGISSPTGTEMFHFPASPPAPYDIQTRVTPHNGRRVPPFGNPRITARKPAPRGISQATASFIGPRCQGIHRTLIKTNNTQQHNTRRTRDAHHTGARRTTNQTRKQTNGRPAAQFTIPRPPADARVHYAVHNQPAHNPRPPQKRQEEAQGARTPGRTAPEPDSMPRPPHPRPATSGTGEGGGPGPRPTARNPRPQRPRPKRTP